MRKQAISHPVSLLVLRATSAHVQCKAPDGTQSTFGQIFPPDSPITSVYDTCVHPLVISFLEGYNAAFVLFGESGSGKTRTLVGNNHAEHGEPGLVHWIMKDLFADSGPQSHPAVLKNKTGEYLLSVSAYETHNELIFDLLQPGAIDGLNIVKVDGGEVALRDKDGVGLAELPILDQDDGTKAMVDAVAARNSQLTAMGPVRARSSSVIELKLIQSFDSTFEKQVVSTFHIVIAAGAECLTEDPDEMLIKAGPALNKSIITLAKVVNSMSGAPRNVISAEFDESKLTRLHKDMIGGNCITSVLCTARTTQTPALGHVLRFSNNIGSIANFPVFGDKNAFGLLERYKRLLEAASWSSDADASVGKGMGVDKSVLRLNDLQGQVVQVNMELLRLQAANDDLKQERSKRAAELSSLIDEKSLLEVEQLQGEESRLRSEKEKIDFQIKNAQLKEDSEKEAFGQANKYLLLEHDLVEANTRRDAMEASNMELKTKVKDLEEEFKEFQEEYLNLRETLKTVKSDLETTQKKKENIELELLRVSNVRVALLKEKDSSFKDKASNIEASANALHSEIAAKLLDLSNQNKALKEANRTLNHQMHSKKASAGYNPGDVDALKELHTTRTGALEGEMHALKEGHFQANMDVRKYMRSIDEAKAALKTSQHVIESLEIDNERLSNDQARVVQEYRERLDKYVRDIGEFAGKAQKDKTIKREPELKRYVDVMIKDMITTYSFREQELERTLDRQRKERRKLSERCDQAVQAYQGCKLQLKAAGVKIPASLDIDLAGIVTQPPLGSTAEALTRGSSAPGDGVGARSGGGGGGRKAGVAGADLSTLQGLVSEYTKTSQRRLEKERAGLLVRCTTAEQTAIRLETYITTHMVPWQKEIIRLRSLLGQKGKSGSAL